MRNNCWLIWEQPCLHSFQTRFSCREVRRSSVRSRRTWNTSRLSATSNTALLNRAAAKLLQVSREMFRGNAIITPRQEFWNKFFVKRAQNQRLGEKWAATSKRLRSTDLIVPLTPHQGGVDHGATKPGRRWNDVTWSVVGFWERLNFYAIAMTKLPLRFCIHSVTSALNQR